MSDEAVCYAQSSRGAALAWTTLAFFAGFAGVSAFGPIVTKLKQSMALSPLLMGLLAASPALSGSLLRCCGYPLVPWWIARAGKNPF
jgi:NNP family nitrate/nitrite transporter-like MFS transporter